MKPILFLALATCFFFSCNNNQQAALPELSQDTIPVTVAAVNTFAASGDIVATGVLATANETRYAFKIGGVIDRILVSEGQSIHKGQLLAALKLTEIDAQLSQASLAYEKAKREFTRTNNLYRDSVATLEQVQNAKTALDLAASATEAVTFNKQYARIYARTDGFVTKKLVNEQEVVSVGAPVLLINENTGPGGWTLRLGLPDKAWAAIELGQAATVTIDAFPGQSFPAVVFRKSPAADPASGSFQVELKLAVNGFRPAIGMFAKATIHSKTTSRFPAIPYDALIEADGNSAFVFIPDGDHKVRRVPVVIESFDNHAVFIKSGLENVSQVIVSNSAFLNEASTVHIIK
jgi:RND family efflux transporter MFP subunit